MRRPLLLIAAGLWANAMIVLLPDADAHGPSLSRQDVEAAVRDALGQNPRLSAAELRAALAEVLRGCSLKGQRSPDKTDADRTDIVARFTC